MNFKYFLNIQNYAKIFYKPAKILPTLKIYWNGIYNKITEMLDKTHDVKYKKLPDNYMLGVYQNSLKAMERLTRYADSGLLNKETVSDVFGPNIEEIKECIELGDLFNSYGSDKAVVNSYHSMYYSVLNERRNAPLQILEIGLGTNNLDVMSNMGRFGKPGASLRAFRDFLPNANVYGADVDKRILFTEDRIETFYIDQTNTALLQTIKDSFGDKKFDLIIDDGLHNSEANLNVIDFALDLLSEKGALIIEDIKETNFIYYQLLSKILEGKFIIRFIRFKHACVCYIRPDIVGK